MKYVHTIDIDAPAATVWATVAAVPNWPTWTQSVSTAEWVGDSGLAVGHAARIKQPKLRATTWKVTSVDEGRSFTWEAKSPGFLITASHVITSRDGGVTVTLSTNVTGIRGPFVGAMTAKIGKRYVEMEAEGLKRMCEGKS
jgi:uncharacterized membrane protein